jgi:hypothetical protein
VVVAFGVHSRTLAQGIVIFPDPQLPDWNDRSRKVAEAIGFQREDVLESTEGDFLVMTRQARLSEE